MKASSLSIKRVDKLLTPIRRAYRINGELRRELLRQLIEELELLSKSDVEYLVCPTHAKRLTGVARTRTLHLRAVAGSLHQYQVCCRRFYDRRELEELKKGTFGSHNNCKRP